MRELTSDTFVTTYVFEIYPFSVVLALQFRLIFRNFATIFRGSELNTFR